MEIRNAITGEVINVKIGAKSGNYDELYTQLDTLEVGQFVPVTPELGLNEDRTLAHNRINISSACQKFMAREGIAKTFTFVVHGEQLLAVRSK